MKTMGCCFSCKDDDDAQGARQQLIRGPVSNSRHGFRVSSNSSDSRSSVLDGPDGQPARGEEDELQRILQGTASAMIDIPGLSSHSLDRREFQERNRHYGQKIRTLSPELLRGFNNPLLSDVPIPERHLNNAQLISQEDMMDWATSEIEDALHSIRVEQPREDIVVPLPFGCTEAALVESE